MKYVILLLLIGFLMLTCGGNQQDQMSNDGIDPYKRAELERNEEYGYEPPPPPVKGPHIPVDSLVPGTCAYAAAKFSQALAAVDSSEAMKYCTDTTKLFIRAMFLNTAQLESLRRVSDAGMYIKSVAIEQYLQDSTVCRACVTAVLHDEPDESCGFMLRLVNNEWKIFQLGQ